MTKSHDGVEGRRSPRWAFWSRMKIPCENGLLYLARLRIIQTPWFGVYLHDIHEPDGDRDPHNHPWSFISIVLRGSYVERVYPHPESNNGLRFVPGDAEYPKSWNYYVEKRHRRFSAHRMGQHSAHRIVEAAPGLKTLILVGPRQSGWGFFVRGEYVPWQEYVTERDGGATGRGNSVLPENVR